MVESTAVPDVEHPGCLGHDHLQYSTVQYSTVQYGTVLGAFGHDHLQLVLKTVLGDVLQRQVKVVVVKLKFYQRRHLIEIKSYWIG